MKSFILYLLFTFTALVGISAQTEGQPTDSVHTSTASEVTRSDSANIALQAKAAYDVNSFHHAIELLEKEKETQLSKGLESADLYYNLGNAYFRANEIAKAILYYEKAQLINPGDRDVRHNIEYANTKIEDKILVADTFFINIWFRAVQNLFSSNGWATLAVAFFILLISCLTLFFFSRSIGRKQFAFYAGIIFTILLILSNVFAYKQKYKLEQHNSAIIIAASATIHSSPDSNSKELFILHSGTKVYINKEDRNWLEIEIDNGSVGWIQRDKLEII